MISRALCIARHGPIRHTSAGNPYMGATRAVPHCKDGLFAAAMYTVAPFDSRALRILALPPHLASSAPAAVSLRSKRGRRSSRILSGGGYGLPHTASCPQSLAVPSKLPCNSVSRPWSPVTPTMMRRWDRLDIFSRLRTDRVTSRP
eukprot:4212323-Prymnesium_polylepis.1